MGYTEHARQEKVDKRLRYKVTSLVVTTRNEYLILCHSVGDGDNFRIYHMPAFGWRWPMRLRKIPTSKKGTIDISSNAYFANVEVVRPLATNTTHTYRRR